MDRWIDKEQIIKKKIETRWIDGWVGGVGGVWGDELGTRVCVWGGDGEGERRDGGRGGGWRGGDRRRGGNEREGGEGMRGKVGRG